MIMPKSGEDKGKIMNIQYYCNLNKISFVIKELKEKEQYSLYKNSTNKYIVKIKDLDKKIKFEKIVEKQPIIYSFLVIDLMNPLVKVYLTQKMIKQLMICILN